MDETKDLVPVIQIIDGRIQDNLTVVEQRVAEITEQYKNLVVTDVKDAKDTLAKLRKLSSTINAEKIRAKKIFLAPFEEIEQRIKKLAEMISIPVAEIDLQVKTAEQKIRDTRRILDRKGQSDGQAYQRDLFAHRNVQGRYQHDSVSCRRVYRPDS